MTAFVVEHQCPQCGAPAQLQEADRLIRCPFCRVGSYLSTPGSFRYILPDKAPEDTDLIWFPYWRLKGMLFNCTTDGIEKRFVDVSYQAIAFPDVPISLGLRSQTQKLRFALPDTGGTFLKPQISPEQSIKQAMTQFQSTAKELLHQQYIGETLSLIYAPFYYKKRLYDGLLNEPVAAADCDTEIRLDNLSSDPPDWRLEFTATICPACGWDLDGSGDSLILTCPNCQKVWQPEKTTIKQVRAAHQPVEQKNDIIYLPFWRINALVSGVALESYADLVRLANLPRTIQPGWDTKPFYFWSPAFKIRPQKFINVASGITLAQPEGPWKSIPPKGNLYPVNLPVTEAAQTMKLAVAFFLKPKQKLASLLPGIQTKPRSFVLVYLPFRKGPHELINDQLKLAFSKNMLAMAHNL